MAKDKSQPKQQKTKRSSTNRISEYKLLQYNGIQMSRKMLKLWRLMK